MQGDKIQDTNESYVSLREVYLESFTSFEDRLREGFRMTNPVMVGYPEHSEGSEALKNRLMMNNQTTLVKG